MLEMRARSEEIQTDLSTSEVLNKIPYENLKKVVYSMNSGTILNIKIFKEYGKGFLLTIVPLMKYLKVPAN
jgi:hypothetical protein